MATSKAKKTTRKKSPGSVRDLATRKDPKGGAQKREGSEMAGGTTRGRTTSRTGKTRLS